MLGRTILIVLLCAAVPARGDDTKRAASLMAEGQKLQKSGQIAEALGRYRQAHGLDPRPEYLCQIGRALQRLDQFVEARRSYETCLDVLDARKTSGAFVDQVRAWLGDVLTKVRGTLVVVNGPGTRVSIGSRGLGAAPLDPVPLDPGAYVVRLERDGSDATEVPITISSEQATTLDLDRAFGSQVATARIHGTEPGDDVRLDGATVAEAGRPIELRPGQHTVEVKRGDAPPFVSTFTAEAGSEVNVLVVFSDVDEGVSPWPWTLVGAGGAALITGLVFTLVAERQYDEYSDSPTTKTHLRDSAKDNDTIAYSMYATGGALVVGGLIWGLMDLREPDAPEVSFVPMAEGGVVMFGTSF